MQMTSQKIQDLIGIVLIVGVYISTALVLCGGLLFLIRHGNESIATLLIPLTQNPAHFWSTLSFSFSMTEMITIGLLGLVFTQVLRVALLGWCYFREHDYKFAAISLFILLVLLYSLFFRT